MTTLISLVGLIGRFAGDLLIAAFGWAASILFGRVPRSHQIYLSSMVFGSVLWAALLVLLVVPSLAALALSTTPHPGCLNPSRLATAMLVGVLVLPALVGLAGWLVPVESWPGEGPWRSPRDRARLHHDPGDLRPAGLPGRGWPDPKAAQPTSRLGRHARARRHRGRGLRPDGRAPFGRAWLRPGLPPTRGPRRASSACRRGSSPGSAVRTVRQTAGRLYEICGNDLRVGVYPSDIAISIAPGDRMEARATVFDALETTKAHLTTSAEAQKVEDELKVAQGVRWIPARGRDVREGRRCHERPRHPGVRVGHPVSNPDAG